MQRVFKLPLLVSSGFVQCSISLHNLQLLDLLLDGIGVLFQDPHFSHLLPLFLVPFELLLAELFAVRIGGVHNLPTLSGLHGAR